MSQGPVKPKLVARNPNGPNSPWKKSVPTISADGVPVPLRSILGYTLWRLHERETYSFHKDSSILLTSDEEVSTAAHKVGITVQSFDTLFSKFGTADTGLATWGDVEREFGVRSPSKAASRTGHSKMGDNVVINVKAVGSDNEKQVCVQDSGEMAALSTEEDKAERDGVSRSEKDQEVTIKPESESIAFPTGQAVNGSSEEPDVMMEDEAVNGEETPVRPPEHVNPAEAPPAKPRAWADVVSNRIRPIEERYPSPVVNTPELTEATKLDSDASIDPSVEHVDQEKASTIADWVRMVTQASLDTEPKPYSKGSHRKRSPKNKKTEKSSPPQEPPVKPFRPILMQRTPKSSQAASDQAHAISDNARTPSPPPPLESFGQSQPNVEVSVPEQAVEATPVSQHRSTNSSASTAQTAASKDTSAVKSAPIEDPEDSEEEVVVFNPRAKRLSTQQQTSKPSEEEKPTHVRQASGGKHIHAKHRSVEEPKKIQQSMTEKPMPVKQHRPPKPRAAPVVIDPDAFGRDFASNPQPNQNRSHQFPNSQHGTPRPVSQHGPARGGARGGRPFIHPQAITALQNGQHGHANSSAGGGRQTRMPPAVVNGQNGYVATNQTSVAVNGQVAPRPSPRASPRASPLRLPQTGISEPDTGFFLQSGPSRGSTRGRGGGKLWIG